MAHATAPMGLAVTMSDHAIPGRIRPATPADVPEILGMIRDLADYERSLHEVETTEAQLVALLFGGTSAAPGIAATTPNGAPAAYAHVVEHPDADRGTALGAFALWFLNTSTWTGTHGVYLEDLYVRPELRGAGYGTALLRALARVCQQRGYDGSSGGCSTGTSTRSASTAGSEPSAWTSGPCTGSPATRSWPWRTAATRDRQPRVRARRGVGALASPT